MKKISRVYEVKSGRTYTQTFITEDRARVYEDLAQELMNLKVFKNPSYKRMTQKSNYDGTREVVIYQDSGRSVYTIKA